MKALTGWSALAVILANAAAAEAQDGASLRAAIERHYTAIHAADQVAVREHHLPDFTFFNADGRLLLEAGFEEAMERFGTTLDFGSGNVYMNHFNAQIYGDVGVATFYLVGTRTLAREISHGTWRVTAVWIRQGNVWKEAHHHESSLQGGLRPQLR